VPRLFCVVAYPSGCVSIVLTFNASLYASMAFMRFSFVFVTDASFR